MHHPTPIVPHVVISSQNCSQSMVSEHMARIDNHIRSSSNLSMKSHGTPKVHECSLHGPIIRT